MEQIVVPEESEKTEGVEEEHEEIVIREKVRVYPETWKSSFGVRVSVLEQRHYAGDWDVLRPATEIEEMNILTADDLSDS